MSAEKIENLMYDMVADMTIVNGFNFDWTIEGDGDTRTGNRTGGSITIDFDSEDNKDDQGGIGSGQYIDDARVYVTGKVNLATPNTRGTNVVRLTKSQNTRALDDIKQRYDSPKYLKANSSARELHYRGMEVIKMEKEGKFRTMRVKCEFLVKYVTQRKFFDA